MIPEKPSALEHAGKLIERLRSELGIEGAKLKGITELAFVEFDIAIHEAEYVEMTQMRAAFFQMRDQLNVFAQWAVGTEFSLEKIATTCLAAKHLITAMPGSYGGKVGVDKAELDQLRAVEKLYRSETQRVAEAKTLSTHGRTANCTICRGAGVITEETANGPRSKRCPRCEFLEVNKP